jgi:beta-alanine--pyruvate transaminase
MVQEDIYKAFMQGPEEAIELFHGYTYSGHPVAAAAGLAVIDVYKEEGTFEQSLALQGHFEDVLHALADHPLVKDVRNFGLMGAVELESRPGAVGARGLEVHKKCFWDEDLVVRNGADILQFSPFLNSRPDDMTMTMEKIRNVLNNLD